VTTVRAVGAVCDVPRAAWDALVGGRSPFLEWEWLAALEESGAASPEAGWQPSHLTAWEDGELIGACPAYVKAHSQGEFVFDHPWAAAAMRAGIRYYPKLLVGVPFTPVTGPRFLARPADGAAVAARFGAALEDACRARGLSSVHVNFCLPEEVEALAARGWLRRTGWQYHWSNAGYTSFDDYLASLRSKRRNQVRRERRELAAQEVEIVAHAGADIPDELFPLMFRLYRHTIEMLPWGQQYLNARFFELAAERLRERLCLIVARQRGKVIAATFNVEKGGTLYGRYWGALRDLRHLHFNVCYYAAIEYCIARGLARFEPGAGGDFKLLRGFDATQTESMHFVVDPRLADAVRRFLIEERRAVADEIGWLNAKTARRRGCAGENE
jgi:hypothetical protein